MNNKKEEFIEIEILSYLMDTYWEEGFFYHNDIKWFYSEKTKSYRRNKNNFIQRGISDITGALRGKYIAIEVKKPSEMKFFDKSLEDLQKAFNEAELSGKSPSTLKKYVHAIEQREFLDKVVKAGGIGFFASSVEEVKEKLKDFLND